MTKSRTLLATLPLALSLVAFSLEGCGQSGPLYLPGSPSEVQVPPERPQPPAENDEEDEDRNDSGDR